MSQRRKTRTNSTEPSPSRHNHRSNTVRQGVAAEAARIIATEGQGNFQLAKKKAAERVGGSGRNLPSNQEVQQALHDYQQFYGGSQHAGNLQQLREVARDAMTQLQLFSPRLVGPVLDGTARMHSRISLHVFSDTPENLVIYLLDRNIPFDQEERRLRWHDGDFRTIPLIIIEHHDVAVELAVFSPLDLRQAPPSPIDGKPQQRASLAEVEYLLATADKPLPWGLIDKAV